MHLLGCTIFAFKYLKTTRTVFYIFFIGVHYPKCFKPLKFIEFCYLTNFCVKTSVNGLMSVLSVFSFTQTVQTL